jgi:hypothetical protein
MRKTKATSGDVTLTQIGSSALYAPPAANGETWVFLLWDAASAPKSILLGETWSDQGTPARIGDYAFLTSIPTASQAPAIEAALRAIFSEPQGATGFGWYKSSAAFPVATSLSEDAPIVFSDAQIPAGTLQFFFTAKLPIVSTKSDSGAMNGLLFTDPRPAPGAGGYGVVIPLFGKLAGCIVFLGARESVVVGDSTVKMLVNVSIDPLRLTNKDRTFIKSTQVRYVLSGTAATGYSFLPYSP